MSKDNKYFDTVCQSIENSIRIDSLKLRFPLSLVTLLDNSILDCYAETNLNTGEVDPTEFKLKAKEFHFTETSKVKILTERRPTQNGKIEDCLVIYLNSKILKERYFEGIHLGLIQDVYSDLMSLKVFSIDYESFLNADCTDIDLKFDEVMTQLEWTELLTQFKQATIPSPQADKGYKPFPPTSKYPLQNGLMYNKRATATPSRPFLKLYWKGGEMLSKSKDYYDEHLSDIDQESIKQLVRIETTIKNKNHAKGLGIDNTTLLSLLSLTEETKESVFRQMIGKYLHKPTRVLTTQEPQLNKPMSPDQLIQYYSIILLMEHTKHNGSEVIISLIQGIKNPQVKSRKKKELTTIYEQHIKGNKIDLSTEKINSFYTKFGWN